MLQFFRKYQKFFFLLTTIIIVFSFVFFGTYQAIAPSLHRKEKDEVLFKTLDGTKIHQSYFAALQRFLDSENWMVSHGPISANFLNDGVVSKDFLDSGLAICLLPYLPEGFKNELAEKLVKEKNYVPYSHPAAPQLSAMSVWSLFAPEIPQKLALWKNMENGHEMGPFEERVGLFLAQKKFPPAFLSQVIRYQQREYLSYGSDPRLMKDDLGLFGYHHITDWFGHDFMDAVCRSIIQTASFARKKGFTTHKGQALQELASASQKMYDSLREKCDLPVSDGYGLLQIYLRQNGLDEKTAIKIWEDISLFRKILATVGNGAVVDLLAVENFYQYAHENVSIELYQMPKEFRFETLQDLKRFEAYLEAVALKRKSPLDLPSELAPLTEIEKKAPELVGKKYRLFVAEANNAALSGKVSVKETWDWECDPQNWEKLKKEFPDISKKAGEPLEVLEKLDSKMRRRIDSYARGQIVAKHPEWILETIKEKNMEEKEIFLTSCSENPLPGIKDPLAFEKNLDEKDEIIGYTQDNHHTYRILVQERSPEKTVLSFKEALKSGVLDACVERLKVDSLVTQVVNELALKYLPASDVALEKKEEKVLPYRFVEFLEKKMDNDGLLSKQWSIEKTRKTITRSEPQFLSFDDIVGMEVGGVSKIKINPKEGPYYFRLLESGLNTTLPLEKVASAQELLAKEVKRNFFENLLKEIEKG